MKELGISDTQSEMATEVVEDRLKIKDFIADHSNDIFDRLEECENSALEAEAAPNIDFFAEAFPVIGSVIHVGSKRQDYTVALDWARQRFPNGEPVSVLTALTFLYIAEQGREARSGDPDKKDLWKGIMRRLAQLLASP